MYTHLKEEQPVCNKEKSEPTTIIKYIYKKIIKRLQKDINSLHIASVIETAYICIEKLE